MSNWVETEMVACQLHDARHAKRLSHLLGRLSEQPVHRIPSVCHGWAETVAAYRCLDKPGHWRPGDALRTSPRHAGADSDAGGGLVSARHDLSG